MLGSRYAWYKHTSLTVRIKLQAKGDAAQAQEEVALLRRQLVQRGVLQALPNDSFNMGTWLSRKFERSRSARSSGRPSSVPTHTSPAKAVVQQ